MENETSVAKRPTLHRGRGGKARGVREGSCFMKDMAGPPHRAMCRSFHVPLTCFPVVMATTARGAEMFRSPQACISLSIRIVRIREKDKDEDRDEKGFLVNIKARVNTVYIMKQ